jgi:hypothetical protein
VRDRQYLRTPLKPYNFSSLTLQEIALRNDFGRADPGPQSIEILFTPPPGQSSVEIALVWDGLLRFLPDDSSELPQTPEEVTESNFPDWNLTGTLILLMTDSLSGARVTGDVPLLASWPTVARYEKVTLTRAFLFTTLKRVPHVRFRHEGSEVSGGIGSQDQRWFEKFVIEFVNGRGAFFCPIDSLDPALDFTEQPMPVVAGSTFDSTFKLLFSCASRNVATLFPDWFRPRVYDDPGLVTTGANLVPLSLNSEIDLNFNTRHPSHSIIPSRLIFASAPDDAWVPSHSAHPVRNWARTPLPDGQTYRRIDLLRNLRREQPVSVDLMRPYPLHQLVWKQVGTATVDSFRIPLDGHIYVPLADGDYTFCAIPRAENADAITTGDEFKLSGRLSHNFFVNPPQASLTQTVIPGENEITLYADLHPHDHLRIWSRLMALGKGYEVLQDQANSRWGVWDKNSADDWHHPNNWFIYRVEARKEWGNLYAYILAAAGRHGIAPEFLHTVFMGEGGAVLNKVLDATPGLLFNPNEDVPAWELTGLDLILYRLRKNELPPPRPDPEYMESLIDECYLDPNLREKATRRPDLLVRDEADGTLVLEVAIIKGWEAVLELVAAELHFRQDKMLEFCAANGISVTNEEQRQFLAYIRYLSSETAAHAHALRMNFDLRKWSAADDPKPTQASIHRDAPAAEKARYRRYETLRRLAITDWYEASEVYR